MTKSQLTAILKNIGVEISSNTTGFIQLPELTAITMTNDGEQHINYHTDMIEFDIANELVKIKEYKYEKVNKKIIFKGLADDKKNLKFEYDVLFTINPGDVLYFLDVDRKSIINGNYTIKKINNGYLEVDKEITLPATNVYAYIVPKDLFATSQLDIMDIRQRYIMKPVSKYTTDIYIPIDSIQGLRF